VGGGTWTVLARNREEISRRAGRDIRISVVADKEVAKAKKLTGGDARVVADAFAVVRDPEVDIVIELIGGTTVAKVLVLAAIESASTWSQRTRRCSPPTATRFSPRRRRRA